MRTRFNNENHVKVSETETVKTVDNSDQDDNSQLDWVPAGVSSCAKWNRYYKILINNWRCTCLHKKNYLIHFY